MKKSILVVEDDIDLNYSIAKYLKRKGLEVTTIFDGQDAVDEVYEKDFDIMILDIKLPTLNGFEVAKKVREFSSVPIIFLTSLNSQKDIEKGFLTGADDYITKPFSLKELYLRIEAIYRRLYGNKEIIKIDENLTFETANLMLFKNGESIHLKRKEAKLLAFFLQRKGEILTKEEIFNKIYDYHESPNESSLRTFIYRLRSILPRGKIETIKDIGYRYVS